MYLIFQYDGGKSQRSSGSRSWWRHWQPGCQYLWWRDLLAEDSEFDYKLALIASVPFWITLDGWFWNVRVHNRNSPVQTRFLHSPFLKSWNTRFLYSWKHTRHKILQNRLLARYKKTLKNIFSHMKHFLPIFAFSIQLECVKWQDLLVLQDTPQLQ